MQHAVEPEGGEKQKVRSRCSCPPIFLKQILLSVQKAESQKNNGIKKKSPFMLSDIAAEKDVNQSQIMVVGVLSLSHDSIQRTFVARETHSCSQQSLLVQI